FLLFGFLLHSDFDFRLFFLSFSCWVGWSSFSFGLLFLFFSSFFFLLILLRFFSSLFFFFFLFCFFFPFFSSFSFRPSSFFLFFFFGLCFRLFPRGHFSFPSDFPSDRGSFRCLRPTFFLSADPFFLFFLLRIPARRLSFSFSILPPAHPSAETFFFFHPSAD